MMLAVADRLPAGSTHEGSTMVKIPDSILRKIADKAKAPVAPVSPVSVAKAAMRPLVVKANADSTPATVANALRKAAAPAAAPVVFVAFETFNYKGDDIDKWHLIGNGILPTDLRQKAYAGLGFDKFRKSYKSSDAPMIDRAIAALEAAGVEVRGADAPLTVEDATAAARALPQIPVPEDVKAARDARKAANPRSGRSAPAAAAPSIVTLEDGRRAVIVDGRALILADQGEEAR
jgi:hypothetical protein